MAFSSTVSATSGTRKGAEEIAPNLYLVRGTWNAAAVTAGEIDLTTYGSLILAAGFSTKTGTGITKWGMNCEDDGTTTTNGKLSIVACTANDTGDYWAMLQR